MSLGRPLGTENNKMLNTSTTMSNILIHQCEDSVCRTHRLIPGHANHVMLLLL